jgi:hypothetical protein
MFPQMFPCLPTRGNIIAETKFASREAKMFPKTLGKLGNIVAETLFPTNVPPCFQEWANTRKH